MRGEEVIHGAENMPSWELPPHARRRGTGSARGDLQLGITSACAEKSTGYGDSAFCARNYLRMRGEEP